MNGVREPILAALGAGHPLRALRAPAGQHRRGGGDSLGVDRGDAVKNLFLRNKKGDRHYLVILGIEKQADLRQLVKVIGDDRLSFGSAERLMKQLGVTPGTVSPFGLLHDAATQRAGDRRQDLRAAERLIFHPNDNTASVTICVADFERFLATREQRAVGEAAEVGSSRTPDLQPDARSIRPLRFGRMFAARIALAQPDVLRRHLDELVVVDQLDRLLEAELARRDQADRFVGGRGAHVRLLLFLRDVDVHVGARARSRR